MGPSLLDRLTHSCEKFLSMLEDPRRLLSVSRCDILFEQEQVLVAQWLLPKICSIGISHELHDVNARNFGKGRKMGRRRPKGKNKKSSIEASDVQVVKKFGGSTEKVSSMEKDDGFKVHQMVSVIEMVEDVRLHCTGICEQSSTSHVEMNDEVVHDATVDDTSYLPGLDDAVALRCLAFLPRMYHGKLSLVSRRHRELVRSSLLFKLRQEYSILEKWICIYTTGNNGWTAFDPKHNVWRNLPHVDVGPGFDMSDKESLSAGTHLMWLGREAFDFACYRYDLASDGWERGPPMVNARCLFASATSGKFAYVAGGFTVGGLQFDILNTVERYDSSKGIWEPLPDMATPRQKCSGFFMDGKFYVIGGNTRNHEPLMSGEEYDPEMKVWRTIENMYSTFDASRSANPSPPLVAVAGNELYAIETSSNLLKVYEKQSNTWRVLGRVPVRADFCNGWGLAFRSLGDELFVIGGHRISSQEREGVAVFSWRPTPGANFPDWQLVNSRMAGIGNFLFNCAVMAC